MYKISAFQPNDVHSRLLRSHLPLSRSLPPFFAALGGPGISGHLARLSDPRRSAITQFICRYLVEPSLGHAAPVDSECHTVSKTRLVAHSIEFGFFSL